MGNYTIYVQPYIGIVNIAPQPANISETVNVSLSVWDPTDIPQVNINLTGPSGVNVGNFTMPMLSSEPNFEYRYRFEYTFIEAGDYNYTVWAVNSFNNWDHIEGQIVVIDTIKPNISDLVINPNVQEVYGSVNISVNITDNDSIMPRAHINITKPDGTWQNETMSNIGNNYFHEQSYDIIGIYNFIIWANDTSNNLDIETGSFTIQDTEKPKIPSLLIIPSTQEVYGYVNISASIIDNYDLFEDIWINIIKPDGFSLNITMDKVTAMEFYYNDTYKIIGTYIFTIWANDTSNNWNDTSGQFTVVDTTKPIANAGPDQQVEQGYTITLDGSGSSDNIGFISNYTWNLTVDGTLFTFHGANLNIRIKKVGNFEVTLTVKDSSNNSASDTMWINVTGVDTDSDGLTDYDEINIYGTKPNNPDTDGDGINDGDEVIAGTDPLVVEPKDDKDFLSEYWWIIAIVIIVLVIGLLLSFFLRKKKEPEEEEFSEESPEEAIEIAPEELLDNKELPPNEPL